MAATKSKVWQFLKGEEGSNHQKHKNLKQKAVYLIRLHRFKLKVHAVINIAIYRYIEALHIEIVSTSKF